MPVDLVFHKGNALTLYRVSNDSGGSALASLSRVKCRLDLVKVMAVDGNYVVSKSFKLALKGSGADNLGNRAVDLKLIIVKDNTKIVQLIVVFFPKKGITSSCASDFAEEESLFRAEYGRRRSYYNLRDRSCDTPQRSW